MARQLATQVCTFAAQGSSIALAQRLLASMPEGYLAPALFTGEYAQRLSRTSTSWLLASMPEGCLALEPLIGESAQVLSLLQQANARSLTGSVK